MVGKRTMVVAAAVLALETLSTVCRAGAELEGWGDFRGMRVNGELMRFASSLRAVSPDGKQMAFTATEMVKNPKWSREGTKQISTGTVLFPDGKTFHYRQSVEDLKDDTAKVELDVTADVDLELSGVYYYLNLPASDYASWQATVDGEKTATGKTGKVVEVLSAKRNLKLTAPSALPIKVATDKFIDTDIATQDALRLPRDTKGDELVAVSIQLAAGNLAKGQTVHATFELTANGLADTKPVKLTLDAAHPGPPFDGIGGNFRVYGAEDRASMDYNLTNLRVPWGRVAMVLNSWQPREDMDPIAAVGGNARGAANVRQNMEIAKALADKGIPVVVTTWEMPSWALEPAGPPLAGRPFNIPARRVKPEKAKAAYDAIASYLKYLKDHYGVEAAFFSLNECDLGIDILQTPAEHAAFIREMGQRFEAAGLKTKFWLGDACSPHPVKFIDTAMNDPDALKYIGGVSYHSWHDGTDEEFKVWGDNAKKLGVPLFIGEGGTDSDSYRYPAIFQEPWYSLYEVETYIRICALSQPRSILHWQMTANYSLLVGGGRSGEPLGPGRRFWHAKQINLTPPGAAAAPVAVDGNGISAAGYVKEGSAWVHVVNNGAAREATFTGLPTGTKSAHVYITDMTAGMKELPPTTVKEGAVTVTLPKESLLTLVANP